MIARRAAEPAKFVVTMIFAGFITALMLVAGPVSSASAAECDTSWVGGDGDWTNASNWTNGLPGAHGPVVCITEPGTYTVHVTARNDDFNNSIASAPNLVLGGSSGQQTVAVDGTFTDQTASASLAVGAGTIRANGRIVLSSNDPNHVAGASLCGGGSLTNEGTLQFDAGTGGSRTIQGSVINEAAINVNGDTVLTSVHSCGNNSLLNAGGTINIASGATLTTQETFTQTWGTTSVDGAFNGSGNFAVEEGTFIGNSPVLTTPLIFSPSGGNGTFVVHGNSSFGSRVGEGITVIAEATADEDTGLSFGAESNGINAGTIQLTSNGAGHTASLQGREAEPAGLINTGTIETLPGSGGSRTLGLGLTNQGTIKIGADTDGSCCSNTLNLVNKKGVLTIDAGKLFSLGGALFTQTRGSTTAVNGAMTGAGNSVFAVEGGNFTGNAPVLTHKLLRTSGGSGSFVIHGSTDFLSDIGKHITLVVEGALGENARLGERDTANHSTNFGTIKLTSTSTSAAELSAYDTSTDSLSNAGTIETLQGAGGERVLSQEIANKETGTIAINADTKGFLMQLANSGTLSVAAGNTLSFGEPLAQTAGTAIINGALTTSQPLTIQGGTLRGAGTVAAPTVDNSGGTVHPGNSPGALTISGNYTQGPGGTLATDIAGAVPGSGYSRLAISGNATLNGTLDVINGFVPTVGQAFQILTTGGTSDGAFSSMAVHGEPGYDLQYNPADVTLIAHAVLKPPALPDNSSAPPASTSAPAVLKKPIKCREGTKRKRVKGKMKCVKIKPKKKHAHRQLTRRPPGRPTSD